MIPYLNLSLAHIRHHWMTSVAIVAMIALSTAAVVVWHTLESGLIRRAVSDSDLVDAVVGAKGSPLQLVLSSVYHLDAPTGNIPMSALREIDSMPGIQLRVPISLGDAFSSFRIIGTTHDFLDSLYNVTPYVGERWTSPFEVVLGKNVAEETGLQIGEEFISSHGLGMEGEAHDHTPFVVVGLLPSTSTVLDDLIITSLESVWMIHDHEDVHSHDQHDFNKDITAVLIRFSNPYMRFSFAREINSKTSFMAASPLWEVNKVLTWFGVGFKSIRIVGGVFILLMVLTVALLLGIQMKERRMDMALLLNNGFSKKAVFWIPLVDFTALISVGLCSGIAITVGAVAWLRRISIDTLPRMELDWIGLLPLACAIVVSLAMVMGLLSTFGVVRRSVPDLISMLSTLLIIVLIPVQLQSQPSRSASDEAWRSWVPLAKVNYELRSFRGERFYWPVVSSEVRAMNGKTVTIRGYLILQLAEFRTKQFYLSKVPESQCFFCGGAGPESVMEVFTKTAVPKTSDPITVRGRLVVNTTDPNQILYSLVDAEWIPD